MPTVPTVPTCSYWVHPTVHPTKDLEVKASLLLVSFGFFAREMCGNARMNAHLYAAVRQQQS